MESAAVRGPAVVLYDGDCGFCRWSLAKVLGWDRDRRLRPVSIQSVQGASLLGDLSEEERMESWHLIVEDRRYSAGAALAPMLRLLPGGRAPAALAERFPATTERAYRLIAANRGRLGRLFSADAPEGLRASSSRPR